MKKTLYILRHAKAQTGTATQEDFDRALTQSGMETAQRLGHHLAGEGLRPQLVLCSSAVRTRQTLDGVQDAFNPPLVVEYRDKIYNSSAGEMLSMFALLDESISSCMVVAHNPGIHQLAVKLAREGDDKTLDTLALKYPPCSLTIVESEGAWRDVAVSNSKLIAFLPPSSIGGIDE